MKPPVPYKKKNRIRKTEVGSIVELKQVWAFLRVTLAT